MVLQGLDLLEQSGLVSGGDGRLEANEDAMADHV
jgi:hypothetical protein